jgi:hypothetical protein
MSPGIRAAVPDAKWHSQSPVHRREQLLSGSHFSSPYDRKWPKLRAAGGSFHAAYLERQLATFEN